MVSQYIEIDSTYRNRAMFPSPAYFEIPISQSGRKDAVTCVDPVSLSAPISVWTSNNFSYTLAPTVIINYVTVSVASTISISNITSQQTFIVVADNPATPYLQKAQNYYDNCMIVDTSRTPNERRRIVSYKYLGLDGIGQQLAQITVETPFGASFTFGDIMTITDPTDLSDVNNPYIFVPSGKNANDAYYGYYLYNETRNEARVINSYDYITHLVSVDASVYPVTSWTATDNYSIRKEVSIYVTTVTASNTTSVKLASGSSITDYYANQFIRLRATVYGSDSSLPSDEIRRIISYDATNNTVYFTPSFSSIVPIASTVEILQFSYDNLNPFVYNGSLVSQQEAVCFSISLLKLVLPNQTLKTGQGSRIAFYPYVYVEFSNVTGSNSGARNLIISNNPNSTRMLFRANINDVQNPIVTTFVKVSGDGMRQYIKFKPNDTLRFSVHLPNGDLYDTILNENFSPLAPNPLIQISAIFEISRVRM